MIYDLASAIFFGPVASARTKENRFQPFHIFAGCCVRVRARYEKYDSVDIINRVWCTAAKRVEGTRRGQEPRKTFSDVSYTSTRAFFSRFVDGCVRRVLLCEGTAAPCWSKGEERAKELDAVAGDYAGRVKGGGGREKESSP